MDHSVADRFGTTNYRKNNLYPKVNHHKKKVVLFRMMMNPYYTLKKRWFVNQPIKNGGWTSRDLYLQTNMSFLPKGQGSSSTQHYVEHSMRSYAQVSKHIVVYPGSIPTHTWSLTKPLNMDGRKTTFLLGDNFSVAMLNFGGVTPCQSSYRCNCFAGFWIFSPCIQRAKKRCSAVEVIV